MPFLPWNVKVMLARLFGRHGYKNVRLAQAKNIDERDWYEFAYQSKEK